MCVCVSAFFAPERPRQCRTKSAKSEHNTLTTSHQHSAEEEEEKENGVDDDDAAHTRPHVIAQSRWLSLRSRCALRVRNVEQGY